jgi:hypothetical protein
MRCCLVAVSVYKVLPGAGEREMKLAMIACCDFRSLD